MNIYEYVLGKCGPALGPPVQEGSAGLPADLLELLRMRNGFYSADKALLVFPSRTTGPHVGIEEWNGIWKEAYGSLGEGYLCFAENILGDQFAYGSDGIVMIEAEDGKVSLLAENIEGWLEHLVDDYNYLVGGTFADAYEDATGQEIPDGYRFMAKMPFCFGGEYAYDNLTLVRSLDAVRERGAMAQKFSEIPEGATVKFQIVD